MAEELQEWCARCHEDGSPISKEPVGWSMGKLRRLSKAPRSIRQQLAGSTGDFLCGNCYFDLTDEV